MTEVSMMPYTRVILEGSQTLDERPHESQEAMEMGRVICNLGLANMNGERLSKIR